MALLGFWLNRALIADAPALVNHAAAISAAR
jgi:hypothetical protein